VAPNAEEIKLPPQKIRPGDNTVSINVDLPIGYHLNPSAPQRYKLAIGNGADSTTTGSVNANKAGSGVSLPLRIVFGLAANTGVGPYALRGSFTFVYCRDDNTGTCRIKTLQWDAPLEVVNDATATREIKLSGKVTAE
jgi:hypothetical protein